MGFLELLIQPFLPLVMIAFDLIYAGISIGELLLTLNFSTLLSKSKFKSYWFARFWRFFGPFGYEVHKDDAAPLVGQAKGVVLDIGTGDGLFLKHFDKSQVTKIYAIETNYGQHPGLFKNAKQAGFADTVEVFGEPLELLQGKGSLKYGTIDTVVTVHVMCTVDDPQTLAKELYRYLKPGGRWIVFEHVKVEGNGLMAKWQGMCACVRPLTRWLTELI
jgi:SAM-dependent methyltransferase